MYVFIRIVSMNIYGIKINFHSSIYLLLRSNRREQSNKSQFELDKVMINETKVKLCFVYVPR